MSKIETYKEAAKIAECLARDAHQCLGRDGPDNDKHHAAAQFQKIENARSCPMLIAIELSHGYYGASEHYIRTSADMGRYLAKAITQHMPTLLDAAVALAQADAEAARKDAESEARAVLEASAA